MTVVRSKIAHVFDSVNQPCVATASAHLICWVVLMPAETYTTHGQPVRQADYEEKSLGTSMPRSIGQ
jgi:hypothetical protein